MEILLLPQTNAQLVSSQHETIGAQVGRRGRKSAAPLRRGDLHREARRDDVGHVVLKGEHVAVVALQALGPDDLARQDLAALDVDPDPPSVSLQTASQKVADAQPVTDHLGRHARVLEHKGRMARDHQEVAKAAEIGDDVAGDAVAQVDVARIAGQVGERQHGHRSLGRRQDRRVRRQLDHRWRRRALLDDEHFDGLGDVLQALVPEGAQGQVRALIDHVLNGGGETDPPGRAKDWMRGATLTLRPGRSLPRRPAPHRG